MSSSNCCFLTCIQISQEASQVVWYSHLFQNFPQFVVIRTFSNFSVVKEAEVDVFWRSFAFSMIQWKLAIRSLVPLPFLNPAWTSGSSHFTYWWNLAWRIHSLPYFASLWNQCNCLIVWTFFGLVFSLGLKRKLTFSSPVATAEWEGTNYLSISWTKVFLFTVSRRAVSIPLSMIIKTKTTKNKWKKEFLTGSQNWLSPCDSLCKYLSVL